MSHSFYQRIITRFPSNMSLVFCYGSGIFPQKTGISTLSNMMDFVFVVRDPSSWHQENLWMNKSDYSLPMRLSGSKHITNLMQNFGAGVYFNTDILVEKRRIKYGVISEENLLEDLFKWKTLYIAGRLHKPVHIVHHNFENSPKLLQGLKANLIAAVLTSLLLLPDSFTETQLFHTIAGLSYAGDFRMTFGEDRNKVANIVTSNIERFQELYYPVLDGVCETSNQMQAPYKSFIFWDKERKLLEQDKTPIIQHFHLTKLPLHLQIKLCRIFDIKAPHIRDVEETLKSAARYPELSDVLQQTVIGIVKDSSRMQSMKGILTAGLFTSFKYSAVKVKKMFKSIFLHKTTT